MSLTDVCADKRGAIIERWRDAILASYPAEAQRFFRGEKDRFQNPVGSSIARATEVIVDGVVLGRDAEVAEALESLVRIRAVQEISAAEAVAFVFLLKRVLRQEVGERVAQDGLWSEMTALDDRIDALAGSAFDVYVSCRVQIANMRVGAMRRRTATLLQRLGDYPEESAMTSTDEESRIMGGGKA